MLHLRRRPSFSLLPAIAVRLWACDSLQHCYLRRSAADSATITSLLDYVLALSPRRVHWIRHAQLRRNNRLPARPGARRATRKPVPRTDARPNPGDEYPGDGWPG